MHLTEPTTDLWHARKDFLSQLRDSRLLDSHLLDSHLLDAKDWMADMVSRR
jgi:hypothetical protein